MGSLHRRSAATVKMRVLWDSRTFDIQSVINYKERNNWIQLMCSESV